ncbi:penicillin-binding protein 1A [Corallococcus carmarthensis]|uniref:Penicillin-binding protein 1A n=1 Tax=Corallococcus carmarthensis TaxID=2316728 RepID=A0A3A8K2I9_9BACT|nr:PBP1A family penicillin-binding protein [Corallococcus carmarthensis]NOK22344.1 PBP1A family penicillin-binding protein [Corallococcus carmarthensis]RKG96731.1 PBP1A family penicillin-binding protein [Corallococcus carmarthensis]
MADPKIDRSRKKLVLDGVPPKRNILVRLMKLVAVLGLMGATAGVLAIVGAYYIFSDGLPAIPKVDEYWPPIVTEVYTDDAVLAGEFYNERRKVVPYERIPKRLVQAFIASEDSSFFDHFGVDVLGTTRAVSKTVLTKLGLRGGGVQGGSTLTQQTAKAVLISAEGYKEATAKTPKRKIREAILAFRLEQALTKEEILYLYLNNVFLGHHSYGVQSAAENYYRKDVRDLTLGEMTLIAGLPQAPSRYSPFLRPDSAKKRRSYVLGRMLTEGMISKAEHDQANAEPVKVYPVEDVFHEFAPYFVEQVRKDVVDRYGNPVLLKEGLKVFTTMDSERQRAAQDSVLDGLMSVDKRQGWRGPVMQLATEPERSAFISKARKAMGKEELVENRLYVGVVTRLDDDGKGADVQVGPHQGRLPLLGMRWARKVNPESYYPASMITSVKKAVAVGDVVVLRHVVKKELTDDKEQWDKKLAEDIPEEGVKLFRLEQTPEAQSALVSIDPHRQYLTAMVGGYDFDDNEFNRAFQACRQPGSSFKPFVYSAALEQLEWTEATVIVDSPIVEHDPDNKVSWKPANYSEEFVGDVLLRTALVNSMNIPAVKTFGAVGVHNMADWAKKLGMTTPMNMDFSAALGSSCVYPFDLASVYSTFNRYGRKKPTYFIRKVEDRFGRTLEDHTAFDDAWAPLQDRVAAGYARLFEPGEQVMSPETGYILTHLLRGVVLQGTGGPAQKLGKPAAGKTGTTNDSFDAWFAGYTKDLVTVAWVGYDLNPHPLGRYETGGRAALPIWLNYMKRALEGRPQPEFYPWQSMQLARLYIDKKTGKVASPGAKGAELMFFKKGTEPKEAVPDKNQVGVDQFMMGAQ